MHSFIFQPVMIVSLSRYVACWFLYVWLLQCLWTWVGADAMFDSTRCERWMYSVLNEMTWNQSLKKYLNILTTRQIYLGDNTVCNTVIGFVSRGNILTVTRFHRLCWRVIIRVVTVHKHDDSVWQGEKTKLKLLLFSSFFLNGLLNNLSLSLNSNIINIFLKG